MLFLNAISQFSFKSMSLSKIARLNGVKAWDFWTCSLTAEVVFFWFSRKQDQPLTTWNIGMVGDLQAGHEKLNPQGYALKNQSTEAWDFPKSIFDHHIGLVFIETGTNMATSQCNFNMTTEKIAVLYRWRIPYTVSLFSCWWNHCIFMYIYVYLRLFCQYFRTSKLSEFTSNLVKTTSPSIEETIMNHNLHRQNTFFFGG